MAPQVFRKGKRQMAAQPLVTYRSIVVKHHQNGSTTVMYIHGNNEIKGLRLLETLAEECGDMPLDVLDVFDFEVLATPTKANNGKRYVIRSRSEKSWQKDDPRDQAAIRGRRRRRKEIRAALQEMGSVHEGVGFWVLSNGNRSRRPNGQSSKVVISSQSSRKVVAARQNQMPSGRFVQKTTTSGTRLSQWQQKTGKSRSSYERALKR
jgi:hypothetical protein